MSDFESDGYSTSDVNLSDIDTDDLPDTPNTSDMNSSDQEDSILNLLFNSV